MPLPALVGNTYSSSENKSFMILLLQFMCNNQNTAPALTKEVLHEVPLLVPEVLLQHHDVDILWIIEGGTNCNLFLANFSRHDDNIWKSVPDFFNLISQPSACATIIEAIFSVLYLHWLGFHSCLSGFDFRSHVHNSAPVMP